MLEIKTNNTPRAVLDWHDLTKAEQGEFDYLEDPETADFVRYKGTVYDLGEFLITPRDLAEWHGYSPDTYFSGIVVRFIANDPDYVIVGTYMR